MSLASLLTEQFALESATLAIEAGVAVALSRQQGLFYHASTVRIEKLDPLGFGFYLSFSKDKALPVVSKVLHGSAAALAGLTEDTYILAMDGYSVLGMSNQTVARVMAATSNLYVTFAHEFVDVPIGLPMPYYYASTPKESHHGHDAPATANSSLLSPKSRSIWSRVSSSFRRKSKVKSKFSPNNVTLKTVKQTNADTSTSSSASTAQHPSEQQQVPIVQVFEASHGGEESHLVDRVVPLRTSRRVSKETVFSTDSAVAVRRNSRRSEAAHGSNTHLAPSPSKHLLLLQSESPPYDNSRLPRAHHQESGFEDDASVDGDAQNMDMDLDPSSADYWRIRCLDAERKLNDALATLNAWETSLPTPSNGQSTFDLCSPTRSFRASPIPRIFDSRYEDMDMDAEGERERERERERPASVCKSNGYITNDMPDYASVMIRASTMLKEQLITLRVQLSEAEMSCVQEADRADNLLLQLNNAYLRIDQLRLALQRSRKTHRSSASSPQLSPVPQEHEQQPLEDQVTKDFARASIKSLRRESLIAETKQRRSSFKLTTQGDSILPISTPTRVASMVTFYEQLHGRSSYQDVLIDAPSSHVSVHGTKPKHTRADGSFCNTVIV